MPQILRNDLSPQARYMQWEENTAFVPLDANDVHMNTKYPFQCLAFDASFHVPMNATTAQKLRSAAAYAGKRHGIKFKVLPHKTYGIYEVFRVT